MKRATASATHARGFDRFGWALIALMLASCSSLPDPKVKRHAFPKEVFLKDPKRPYKTLGIVRAKVDYQTLNASWEEDKLCKNYFNKAAHDLLKSAKAKGADAVVDMRSVTFLVDGRTEMHSTPECSDDGSEGQILAQGVAVKWEEEKDAERRSRIKAWEEGKLEAAPEVHSAVDSTLGAESASSREPAGASEFAVPTKRPAPRAPRPQEGGFGTPGEEE